MIYKSTLSQKVTQVDVNEEKSLCNMHSKTLGHKNSDGFDARRFDFFFRTDFILYHFCATPDRSESIVHVSDIKGSSTNYVFPLKSLDVIDYYLVQP